MALINLTKTDFGSLSENLPRLKLSNMYWVENPVSISGGSYVARPSLSEVETLPGPQIRGIYFQDGNGQTTVYVVSGTTLYKLVEGGYTALGTIAGDDFCTFSSTIYHMAIASSGNLYLYDGTLTQVAIPDGGLVADVTSLDNYFIVSIQNTNKFYWIEPGETEIDGLAFASAERNPDDIISMISISDELWAIGQSTVELFTDSGDKDAPFVRIPARVYQVGCADKHSIVKTNKDTLPCLIWVTPTKEVVLAQGTPTKVSNESVEELLRASETFTAWSFRTNRHDFYVLTTDNETVVLDITTGLWFRWSSYQSTKWNAFSGLQIYDKIYAVSKDLGTVYLLSDKAIDDTDFIVCEVGGFVPNATNKKEACNSVTMFLNYGVSPSYTDRATVELRFSDDSGNTWANYYQGDLGVLGSYNSTIRLRSLGSFMRPGRYFEFRFSGLSNFRFDGATMNDTV